MFSSKYLLLSIHEFINYKFHYTLPLENSSIISISLFSFYLLCRLLSKYLKYYYYYHFILFYSITHIVKTTWIQTNISHSLWQYSRSNLPAFQQFPSSLHHISRELISVRNPICVRNFVKSNKSKSSYKTVKKRSRETSLLFLSIKEQEKTEQD